MTNTCGMAGVVFRLSAVFSDWWAGVTEEGQGSKERTRRKISADTVHLLTGMG